MYVIMKRQSEQYIANQAPLEWTDNIQQATHWDRPDRAIEFQCNHRLADSTIILIDRDAWREKNVKKAMNSNE